MIKKIFSLLTIFGVCCLASQIEIIATSSLISAVSQEIAGNSARLTVMIPPGICPGHYEVKPGDIKKLCEGGILLYHGWEGFIEDISKAVSGTNAKMFKVDVPGNWLVPDVQIEAARKITDILKNVESVNGKLYEKNLTAYEKKMQELDRKIKKFVSANNITGTKVVCSIMQKDFLTYLGLDVVDCFGRDEEISPATISQIISKIKKYNVKIVVSNLQSGTTVGEMIARRTNAKHVILSNFPGGLPETKTIEETVMKNLNLLKSALEKTDSEENSS